MDILRLSIVLMGMVLLALDFLSFVFRKVTEGVGLLWIALSGVLFLSGVLPGLCGWTKAVPKEAVPALVLLASVFLLAAFYVSCLVSQLIRKNQELAMHVSRVNQENESILYELKKIKEQRAHEEDLICH